MIKAPGKIVVKEFSLINDYGKASATKTDIWSIVDGMTIHENVFTPYLGGAAKITDSRNLYSTLPITTNTYVLITLVDPVSEQKYTNLYRVYKISDIEQVSPKLQRYIIQFCSTELFASRYIRLSKHVIGNIPNEIELIHQRISTKPIEVDRDAAKADLIIPFSTAHDAINLLVENAKWKATTPDYCYWETLRGYNCRSLASCMLENQIHDFTTTVPVSGDVLDNYNYYDFIKINDIEVKQTFDGLEMLYGGFDGNTIYDYDPLEGKGKATMLGNQPLSRIMTFCNPKIDYSSISKRGQILRNITNSRFYISVPGLLTRSCGDPAKVAVYNGNQMNIKDETLSGRKLILGIAHVISCDDYTQNITLGDYYLGN